MVEQTPTPAVELEVSPKQKGGDNPTGNAEVPPKPKRKYTRKAKTEPVTTGEKAETPKPKRKYTRTAAAKKAQREDKLTSVVMGIAIPLMVLSCSHSVSTFWVPAPMVAVAFAVVGLGIMGVSITHLTDSLMVATKSPRKAAFLMALGVDALVALPEITAVMGMAEWVQYTTMASMTAISMRLNVVAFLRHDEE